MHLTCPPSMAVHVQKVLQGEYDLPYQHPRPVILDIGANIGSFAAWAIQRWPGCFVHRYEPLPANFELLRLNLGNLVGAIGFSQQFRHRRPGRNTRLFLGKNNCGEASFFDLGEQSSEVGLCCDETAACLTGRRRFSKSTRKLGDRHPRRD